MPSLEEREASAEKSDEEMDDLFGGDESEGEQQQKDTAEKTAAISGIDAVSEDEDDSEIEEEEIQRAELTLPRHPRSHEPMNKDVLMFNLPRFLSVDPEPFAPNNFEQQLNDFLQNENNDKEGSGSRDGASSSGSSSAAASTPSLKDSIQFKKLQLLNTIRWRYAKTPNGDLYKQSNAKIIEWDDGTRSLKLGDEYFEIRTNRNEDNLLAFQGGQVLVGLVNVNKTMKVLPPSTNSIAHKILASTIQNNLKLKKTKKINTMVTRVDPELKARENEKALREIERARRKQLAKVEQQEGKIGRRSRSATGTAADDIDIAEDEDDDDYVSVKGKNATNADGYENDDFVVDDDDEVEQEDGDDDDDELDRAAERLRQVKRDGAAKYEKRGRESIDEEDNDEEDGAVRTKKRRVVLEDDDDDE